MRIGVALVFVLAVAAIVGSAAMVLSKESTGRLAVRVEGLPGYVYYDRPYDITIVYENQGGAISGPVELSATLPQTFALAERAGNAARHGERLVWTFDGLDAGERGSVELAVQGTLPSDLTEAVTDLPGYEGHTAFVEGFEMTVTLTTESAEVSLSTVADTGIVIDPPTFTKAFSPDSIASGGVSTLTFSIDNTAGALNANNLSFTDTLPAGVVVANPTGQSQTCAGGMLTATPGSGSLSYTGGSVGAGASCTIQVDVTSASAGMHVNVTGDLTSTLGNSGTATDTLTVNPAPSPTVSPSPDPTAIPTPSPEPRRFVPDPNPSQFPQLGGTPDVLPTAIQSIETPEPSEAVGAIVPPATGDGGLPH